MSKFDLWYEKNVDKVCCVLYISIAYLVVQEITFWVNITQENNYGLVQ